MVDEIRAGLLAFFAVLLLLYVLEKFAWHVGLLDVPDKRKRHAQATPLVGGIAIFLALLVGMSFVDGLLDRREELLYALSLLLLGGLIDDRYGLGPGTKLLVQVVAGLLMVFGAGMQLDNLGNLFGTGDLHLGAWAVPLTVFAVAGVINSLNMIDGADGLAGGIALIGMLIFLAFALSHDYIYGITLLIMSFALVGFMLLNARWPWRSSARVFLGDAGSMMLGFTLAWFAIEQSTKHHIYSPIIAVWILGIPLMDTLSLMVRRMLKGRSPFSADREHLHHILQRAGYSHGQSVLIILALSLVMGLIGVCGWWLGVPDYVMFYAFMTLFALYLYGMIHAWKLMKLIRRVHLGIGPSSKSGKLEQARSRAK